MERKDRRSNRLERNSTNMCGTMNEVLMLKMLESVITRQNRKIINRAQKKNNRHLTRWVHTCSLLPIEDEWSVRLFKKVTSAEKRVKNYNKNKMIGEVSFLPSMHFI